MMSVSSVKTLKVYNPVYARRHLYSVNVNIQEYNLYTGVVVPNPKWVGDDCLCFKTDDNPLRIILKKNIVGLAQKVKEQVTKIQTWTFEGSKGNKYTVTNDNGRYDCSCLGFQFRRNCKHVVAAKGKK